MSSKITQDDRFQPVNTGRVDVFCVPMAAAKSMVVYLKQVMPGQPEAWYERIANEITAGRMPLPRVDGMPDPAKLEPLPKSPKPVAKPKSTVSIPSTVDEALRQCPKRPKAAPKRKTSQPASEATKHNLYHLTKDWRVAFRLADKNQLLYPDKSEQWCWEKAIYDIERDRH